MLNSFPVSSLFVLGFPITIHHHHHHDVVPLAQISLTLSRHFSQTFIASGRSSGLHPVSSHSCCMYVRAGRPAFAWPYVWVHRSTSLMSSGYIIVWHPPSSCGRHTSHSFYPSTVKAISWYSSTGCTCFLHRCISYFDSLAGSEVNIQHL